MSTPLQTKTIPATTSARPLLQLFRIWMVIGAQSFGGGASTLALIRQEFVRKRAWITEDELVRYWTLSMLVPGINLMAYTLQIGKRLAGYRGAFISLGGMLLPSTAITIAITAGFVSLSGWKYYLPILSGIIAGTVGFTFLLCITQIVPLFRQARLEGSQVMLLSVGFVVSAAGLLWLNAPVFIILPLYALAGAFLLKPELPPPLVDAPVEPITDKAGEPL